MSYIEYPALSDLYRMKKDMERNLTIIDYDVARNEIQAKALEEERKTTLQTLEQIDAYIRIAEAERKKRGDS